MTTPSRRLVSLATPVLVALLAAQAAGAAQPGLKTVPGEKWQTKTSMQMPGMTMPATTAEVCLPVGRASAEEASKPQGECSYTNVKRSGNKFSADLKCRGKDAMEGSVEFTSEANRTTGRMLMKTGGETMTMNIETVKIGGACQAIDVGALEKEADAKIAATKPAQASFDICSSVGSNSGKDPERMAVNAMVYAKAGAPCEGRAPPEFCSAIQTRAGFSSLTQLDSTEPGITARSLAICKLGEGKAGVDALRARLVQAAETAGDTGFLVAHAPARAKELARTQCVLKGEMWAGRTSKMDAFCGSNFAENARRGK